MESDFLQAKLKDAFKNADVATAIRIVSDPEFDVNCRDVSHGLQTALMSLCYFKMCNTDLEQLLNVLFERKPDVNIQDSSGRTALIHACLADKQIIADYLLNDVDIRINVMDFEGNSALVYAIQNGNLRMSEELLNHPGGATLLGVYNSKGQSPQTLAQKSGNKKLSNLLDSFLTKSPRSRVRGRQLIKKRKEKEKLSLPPTFSPERRQQNSTTPGRGPKSLFSSQPSNSVNISDGSPRDKFKSGLTSSKVDAVSDKSDLAPPARVDTFISDEENGHPLVLASAKLERNNHKYDSPSYASQRQRKLEYFPSLSLEEKAREHIGGLRHKKRRGSVSLPDLRDCTGCLVNSGDNTPTENDDPHLMQYEATSSDESEDDDENVFTQHLPSSRGRQLLNAIPPRLRTSPVKQLTLPEINTGSNPNLSSTFPGAKGDLAMVSRVRKCSSSKDIFNL